MQALQLTFDALALGAAYSLVALGFVMILNATNAVNFAQGDMVMAGGMISCALGSWLPWPGIALLPIVILASAGLGILFSLIAYFPLRGRQTNAFIISTIAVGLMLQNGANVIFGAAPRVAPALVGGGDIHLGGLVLGRQEVSIVVVAFLAITGQAVFFARSVLGRRLRATAQDPQMARAVGIPVNTMIALTFAFATAFAGIAGLLLSNQYLTSPTAGNDYILKAYIAVTIGGWGSIAGAVCGALLIAVFEVFVSTFVSQAVATIALYVAVLVILFVRPQGIFGRALMQRV